MSTDFTIADVLAWARTKPTDERYNYTDSGNCAVCQFVRETGRVAEPSLGGNHGDGAKLIDASEWRFVGVVPAPICQAAIGDGPPEWTFGALVTRLEALCPETVVTPSEWTRLDAYLIDIERVVEA